MGFGGTTEKCKACNKTVYFVEMVSADGVPYHKTCFKCSHCNGVLVMGSYSSLDGVLYCKPHFEQLFRETGSFTKKLASSGEKKPQLTKAPSKLSSMFSGTQDKCKTCSKTAYPLEKVSVEGEIYHKNCFRCAHGGCYLTTSNYAALDGILYCKPHFAQLFKEKGCYNHVTKTGSKMSGEIPHEEIKAAIEATEEEKKDATEESTEAEEKEEAEEEEGDDVVAQEQA
ncbi:GATA type zinc finger transcription factor family protein [Euphorbia peplus]|nr:GATA type zinc finger transcription factor family protein [Euphorbia peplus]